MTTTFHPVRTPLVIPVAGAVTVGLFLMMRQLIDIGPYSPPLVEERPPVQIRFEVEPVEPSDPVTPDDITPVEPPPPAPRLDVPRTAVDGVPSDTRWTLPPISPPDVEVGTAIVNIDRPPSPSVRFEPVYPRGAADRGLEGVCTVVFDITPQGLTSNVRIRTCSAAAFERASLNAVSRWRYAPQVRDGEPVMYRDAVTQLVFSLGD